MSTVKVKQSDFDQLLKIMKSEALLPDREEFINPSIYDFVSAELRQHTIVLYSRNGHEYEIDIPKHTEELFNELR